MKAARQFSIAAMLYAIFALLATVTVGLGRSRSSMPIAQLAHHHSSRPMPGAECPAHRRDALSVVMESRGIYLPSDAARATVYGDQSAALHDISHALRLGRNAMASRGCRAVRAVRRTAADLPGLPSRAGAARRRLRPAAARDQRDIEVNRSCPDGPNADIEVLGEHLPSARKDIYRENRPWHCNGPRGLLSTIFAAAAGCWPASARSSSGARSLRRSACAINPRDQRLPAAPRGCRAYRQRRDEVGATRPLDRLSARRRSIVATQARAPPERCRALPFGDAAIGGDVWPSSARPVDCELASRLIASSGASARTRRGAGD